MGQRFHFADVIVLCAPTAQEVQKMLQKLSAASYEVRLQMNRSKAQLMTNGWKCKVEVDVLEIQYVEEYSDLGPLASFENRQEKQIDRQIDNAENSYWFRKQ